MHGFGASARVFIRQCPGGVHVVVMIGVAGEELSALSALSARPSRLHAQPGGEEGRDSRCARRSTSPIRLMIVSRAAGASASSIGGEDVFPVGRADSVSATARAVSMIGRALRRQPQRRAGGERPVSLPHLLRDRRDDRAVEPRRSRNEPTSTSGPIHLATCLLEHEPQLLRGVLDIRGPLWPPPAPCGVRYHLVAQPRRAIIRKRPPGGTKSTERTGTPSKRLPAPRRKRCLPRD